jgi:hypothetical protein
MTSMARKIHETLLGLDRAAAARFAESCCTVRISLNPEEDPTMPISPTTIRTIQAEPDLGDFGQGIYCQAEQDQSGKWAGLVRLYRDGEPHRCLVSGSHATSVAVEERNHTD